MAVCAACQKIASMPSSERRSPPALPILRKALRISLPIANSHIETVSLAPLFSVYSMTVPLVNFADLCRYGRSGEAAEAVELLGPEQCESERGVGTRDGPAEVRVRCLR